MKIIAGEMLKPALSIKYEGFWKDDTYGNRGNLFVVCCL